ncbi:MAG: Lrp/AsnC family transcriptional regulator [Gammaproteobacteria bacterium]|nr:Lrp/AsnC family transcriptional regulator [Gammaproteobacteria bacterium]
MEASDADNRLHNVERKLLDTFQHGVPVVARPFAAMAERVGSSESAVITALQRLKGAGIISRVGPVFRPHRVGCSTLAAMAVPETLLEEVAALVSAYAEVNHNYEREHRFNLWFVVTAADEAHLATVLEDIEARSGLTVISLPMLEAYHIDLGFPLRQGSHSATLGALRATADGRVRCPTAIRGPVDQRLVAAVQDGLPLVPRPYAAVGYAANMTEWQVCERIGEWLNDGTIARLGIVVRHHELGYHANGMVVWDVPDNEVSALGARFSGYDFVTLCYRRRRSPPDWNYNLFCMIHGKSRHEVEARVEALVADCGLHDVPHALLFSTRRFKQRGARYINSTTTLGKAVANHG